MINVAKNLNFKVKFIDLNYEDGNINIKKINSLINKSTSALVLTNMFNDYSISLKIKKFCKKKKN